jgi:hypothetical protein
MAYNVATQDLKTGSTPVLQVLSASAPINGLSTGTTNLYTVPTGRTAVICAAQVRLTGLSAFVTVGNVGIGVAAGEDDIFASVALTGLSTVGQTYMFMNVATPYVTVAAGSVIKLGVDTAYNAGYCALRVELIGYLI